ncbi:hypothetical protein GLOIN_2v1479490 [Rhizophagus clarus]|uniref:Uncharacterized protein n=1 Tax=Rhizophagus clarus TaxID=94130 RepID=A0A8H3QP01_9GLOM|nr:hypothetical protein GLOIN_2v1479490 [Rhizophagus clarus]
MARFTCAFIKKDNTICGNSGCEYNTDNDSGYCSSHSAKIYSHNYRMRQKYGAEALQPAKTSELSDEALRPRIPEAPISESDVSSASIHEHLFPVSLQLFADSLRRDLTDLIRVEILGDTVVINGSATETPRIYEDPVSKSDDEDTGLDLFGD